MAQSVELLLDPAGEEAVRREWDRLAEVGLPTERRASPSPSHRPHITLFAADVLAEGVEELLPSAVAALDLPLVVGSPMVFGPRRGRADSFILVRSVVSSVELLEIQRRVALMCEAVEDGQFGPGRWSPHITLARRATAEQIGQAVRVLDRGDRLVRVTACRRWDSVAQRDWLLT